MASKGKKKLTPGERAHIAKVRGETKPKPAPAQPSAQTTGSGGSDNASTPMPAWVFWVGAVLLVAMAGLSLNLSLSHLGYATPGCGEGGSCDQLKGTAFAYVPGTFDRDGAGIRGWPIAYVGTAYFASLLVVWVMSAGTGLNHFVRQVIRVGALASLVYIIIMLFVLKTVCPLCMATHILNFALLGLVEFSTPRTRGFAARSLGVGVAGLVVGNGVLLGVQQSRSAELDRIADAERNALVEELGGAATGNAASNGTRGGAGGEARYGLPAPTSIPERDGFTGRYLIGEPDAPIRIVTVSGFQCESCQRVEEEIRQLLETRNDVSLSMIHFPANGACNPTVNPSFNAHGAACRTARIAEAAGIVGGSDAFWAMSFRLFEHMGQRDNLNRAVNSDVSDSVLNAWLAELGLDGAEFVRAMNSREVGELIASDARYARSVGTNQTPMVFINGREITSWNRPGQITQTVEALGNQNLPRQTAAADSPPGAAERLTDEWRTRNPIPQVLSGRDWERGEHDEAAARIVVWGCYDEQNTQRVDGIARQLAEQYPGVSYEFRFYPFSSACNPHVSVTRYDQACVKARAAITAGLLGGGEAHQRMHTWIMEQGDSFRESDLAPQFSAMGLDADQAMGVMQSSQVSQLLQSDLNTLEGMRRMGITARPAVFVNERQTPWLFGTETLVLPTIVEAALEGDGN